ncbi:Vitamin B12 import ATP-binding protein BtuD [Streptomyces tendae]
MRDEDAVRLEALTKRYGSGRAEATVLGPVDLGFSRGCFTAVMGPSGSGKSTLLQCAAGLDGPSSGRVVLDGTDLTSLNETERTRFRRTATGFVSAPIAVVPNGTPGFTRTSTRRRPGWRGCGSPRRC